MSKFVPERQKILKIKKLHNEEPNYLYWSPNIFRVIETRILGWNGQAVRMGERIGLCRVLVRKPEGNSHLGDPSIDGMIILSCIFRK
jgi:hypothetical protein